MFKSELKGLLAVVAQGITLTFEGLSSAKVTTVFGHEPVFSGSGATLALPDMFADEEKHIAVELSFPALPAGEHPLLRLKLSYADACHCLAQTSVELTAHLTAASDVMEPCEPNFEVITNVKLIGRRSRRTKAPKPSTMETTSPIAASSANEYRRSTCWRLNALTISRCCFGRSPS